MTPDQFARNLIGYMLTRDKPWGDEDTMYDAVHEVVNVIFGDGGARLDALKLLGVPADEADRMVYGPR